MVVVLLGGVPAGMGLPGLREACTVDIRGLATKHAIRITLV
jgi:hypothetical protein